MTLLFGILPKNLHKISQIKFENCKVFIASEGAHPHQTPPFQTRKIIHSSLMPIPLSSGAMSMCMKPGYEIGSHILVVLINIRGYPRAAGWILGPLAEKSYVNLKTHVQRLIIAYCCCYRLHMIVMRFVDLSLFNLHDCE